MGVKISIIGAGSAVFSINLIKDICINRNFGGSTVVLMDIHERRLTGIYNLCKRYIQEQGIDLSIEKTMDREVALQDADFVLHVALDGGHQRMKDGWEVAQKLGYRFGGSLHIMHDEAFWVNFYQLRLMEQVYLDMQRLCPNAWMLMVANPVQAGVTYLCRKYPGAKVIGMCHGGYRALELFDAMGLDRRYCSFEVSGVNHFVFMNSFYYKGEDGFPLLDKWLAEGKHMELLRSADPHTWRRYSKLGPKAEDMYRRYGVYPIGDTASPGGGAWGWWYNTDEVKEKYMDDPEKWWQVHFEKSENSLRDIWNSIEDPNTKVTEFFGAIAADEPMIPTIEALAFDVEQKVIVNILNTNNYVPGIPADYSCECWGLLNKSGVHGLPMTPQPKAVIAHALRDRVANVEMELAALENADRNCLVQLVLMDPWTRSLEQAEQLVDGILNLPCNREMKEYFSKKGA